MNRILVAIPYEIDIGFAIGRLISVFHEMATRLAHDSSDVHFSFSKVGGACSTALPAGFQNLLEFHPRTTSTRQFERLRAYISEHRITSLFALDLPVNAPCLGAIRAAGVRRVISYWGAPMSSPNRGLKLFLKRLEVALLRRTRPDYFIFESRAMQELAVRGRGLPAALTTVIHTGVDSDAFSPNAGAAELVYQRFRIPRHRRIIVYSGHLHERKGVHVLMQAASFIKSELGREDVHFLFLGNYADEIYRFRHYFKAAESHVTFGGYQSDIPALLAGCYAGCIPSTGWDSFPMSSIEMQACGVPVIVSDWQGVPETVVDQETGIVVPVGDVRKLAVVIAALVDSPGTHATMSIAARNRIKAKFTRQHHVDNLVACARAQLATPD